MTKKTLHLVCIYIRNRSCLNIEFSLPSTLLTCSYTQNSVCVYLIIHFFTKTPTKFIIESPISSLKLLSKSPTPVFKVMYQIVQNYSNKCCYFVGVNTFWTVLNSKAVLTRIKNLNKQVYQRYEDTS